MLKLNQDFLITEVKFRSEIERLVSDMLAGEMRRYIKDDKVVSIESFASIFNEDFKILFPQELLEELDSLNVNTLEFLSRKFMQLYSIVNNNDSDKVDMFHNYILYRVIKVASERPDYMPNDFLNSSKMSFEYKINQRIHEVFGDMYAQIGIRDVYDYDELREKFIQTFTDFRHFVHPEVFESVIFENWEFYLFEDYGFKGAIEKVLCKEEVSVNYSLEVIETMLESGGIKLSLLGDSLYSQTKIE